MSEPALTLRLEGTDGLLSNDDGRSWQLSPDSAAKLRELGVAASAGPPLPSSSLTAALKAGLAEASGLQPGQPASPGTAPPREPAERAGVPLGALVLAESRSLADVLATRSTERVLGPLDLTQLATVLFRAGRVRGWREGAGEVQEETRALPSAGACHPIHLEVLTSGIAGIGAGHWRFDPLSCELCRVEGDTDLGAIGAAIEARGIRFSGGYTAIFAVADFGRTLVRYPAGGSLVWRDAGVVLAGLHLCASDLHLASCILSTTALLRAAAPVGEVDLGALVLGARATGD